MKIVRLIFFFLLIKDVGKKNSGIECGGLSFLLSGYFKGMFYLGVCLCLFFFSNFLWMWMELGVILISLFLLIKFNVCFSE